MGDTLWTVSTAKALAVLKVHLLSFYVIPGPLLLYRTCFVSMLFSSSLGYTNTAENGIGTGIDILQKKCSNTLIHA